MIHITWSHFPLVYATAVHSDCMRYSVARSVQDPCPKIQTSFVLTISFLVCGKVRIYMTWRGGGAVVRVRAFTESHIFFILALCWRWMVNFWVGPRASPDDVERRKILSLLGLKLLPLSHPARSQLLCWLFQLKWWFTYVYKRRFVDWSVIMLTC